MWHKLSGELLTTLGMCKRRQLAADSAPNTYLPSMAMTTRLLTEGDVERGHPPDLTMFVVPTVGAACRGQTLRCGPSPTSRSRCGTGHCGALRRSPK